MKLYAIVRPDGTIKRSRRSYHLMVYQSEATARRAALGDGDAVVECEVDLSRPPLFIRQRKVQPE